MINFLKNQMKKRGIKVSEAVNNKSIQKMKIKEDDVTIKAY